MINAKNLKSVCETKKYKNILLSFLKEADKLPKSDGSLITQFLREHIQFGVLREMSGICKKSDGFGFYAQIWSDDHDPPHFHIADDDNIHLKKQRILLTDNEPQKVEDIIMYKNNIITNSLKHKVIK